MFCVRSCRQCRSLWHYASQGGDGDDPQAGPAHSRLFGVLSESAVCLTHNRLASFVGKYSFRAVPGFIFCTGLAQCLLNMQSLGAQEGVSILDLSIAPGRVCWRCNGLTGAL